MFLSRMRVASRLYLGFGLMVALLVVVTAVAVVKVERMERALRANTDVYSQVQRQAINFRGSAHDRSIAVRDAVFGTSSQQQDAAMASIATLAEFYAQSAQKMDALLASPGVSPQVFTLYADIQAAERQAVHSTQKLISHVRTGQTELAVNTLWSEVTPYYAQWLAAINRLIDFKEQHIQATNQTAMDEASSFLRVMFLAVAIAALLTLGIARALARSMVHQLGAEPNTLADVARLVASGNLHPVTTSRQAPANSVWASLAAMQASLAQVVGNVRHASHAVTHSANEIAQSNHGLLQRSQEQSHYLQQAAASMQAMTESVQHNAETAQTAAQLATAASKAAQQGGEVVAQVVHTMEDISASSQHIADIIGVIDAIAFQTNILALNASVEAARAGTQGRGFAVVASEVRALAQHSAEAARQIKTLIESSVAKVGQGTQLAHAAGDAMTHIVAQAQHVAELIAQISTASATQTQDIAQVGLAVEQLDRSTQQNAAMVQQSAAAAEELKAQAALLATAVQVFQLDVGNHSNAAGNNDASAFHNASAVKHAQLVPFTSPRTLRTSHLVTQKDSI